MESEIYENLYPYSKLHENGFCIIKFNEILDRIKDDVSISKSMIENVSEIFNKKFDYFHKKNKNKEIPNVFVNLFKEVKNGKTINDPYRSQIYITKLKNEKEQKQLYDNIMKKKSIKDDEYNKSFFNKKYLNDHETKTIQNFVDNYKKIIQNMLSISETHVARDIVALHSEPNPTSFQQAHTDYTIREKEFIPVKNIGLLDQFEKLVNENETHNKLFNRTDEISKDKDIPYAAIIGLQNETKIVGWKGYFFMKEEYSETLKKKDVDDIKNEIFSRKEGEIIKYNQGDVFIFRGDFLHGGSGYEKSNTRIHIYFDNKKIFRSSNSTDEYYDFPLPISTSSKKRKAPPPTIPPNQSKKSRKIDGKKSKKSKSKSNRKSLKRKSKRKSLKRKSKRNKYL
jgi:hypothetical protein